MAIYPKKKASMIQMSGDSGEVQSQLEGKERIYSRADTKEIITLARKAKTEDDLAKLGKLVYNATRKQDSRKPDFV